MSARAPWRRPSIRASSRRSSARASPRAAPSPPRRARSEEHTSELQSPCNLVCRLLLEKKKNTPPQPTLVSNSSKDSVKTSGDETNPQRRLIPSATYRQITFTDIRATHSLGIDVPIHQ